MRAGRAAGWWVAGAGRQAGGKTLVFCDPRSPGQGTATELKPPLRVYVRVKGQIPNTIQWKRFVKNGQM